jgi:multimeric flavodoxin WrbA
MEKPIKILGINSSPRKVTGPAQENSSTRVLVEHALNYISHKAEVEIIDLVDFDIKPTAGCYSTDENLCGEHCIHYNDDLTKELFAKIKSADAIIFSSPTYWLEMSSRLSALFERLTELDPITRNPLQRVLQGKVAGAIATSQTEGAINVCYDILKKANYLGFIIPPHAFAFHTAGQMEFCIDNKKLLSEDFVAFKNAEMMIENVYKMCLLAKDFAKYWTVYYELTHPLSEAEKRHEFNYKSEKQRADENQWKLQNSHGVI